MRISINTIKDCKGKKEKIAMVTAYDYATAKLVEEAGINLILVGDSLGMVMLGYESTIPVTIEEMIHHTKAVVRGTKQALIVADMPFMTYHIDSGKAMENAARFMQEAGAHAVKLEGGEVAAGTIKRIVDCGIPVMGHIGLTPQFIHQLGGHRVQGKTTESAARLIKDAIALEKAGVFALVLELVPTELAKIITERLGIPTIGIGAGPDCDGQVQVISDLLGLFTDFVPRHARQYATLASTIKVAVSDYISDVKTGKFPADRNSSSMDLSLLKDL